MTGPLLSSHLTSLWKHAGPAAAAAAAWVLVRKCAQPNQNFALPQADPGSPRRPAGDSLTPGFPPTRVRSEPEFRVPHEAGGRSQDGRVQEAVEGQETDRGGVHPAVAAAAAAGPPHQREYSSVHHFTLKSIQTCGAFQNKSVRLHIVAFLK